MYDPHPGTYFQGVPQMQMKLTQSTSASENELSTPPPAPPLAVTGPAPLMASFTLQSGLLGQVAVL